MDGSLKPFTSFFGNLYQAYLVFLIFGHRNKIGISFVQFSIQNIRSHLLSKTFRNFSISQTKDEEGVFHKWGHFLHKLSKMPPKSLRSPGASSYLLSLNGYVSFFRYFLCFFLRNIQC